MIRQCRSLEELYRENLFHIEDYVEQGREGYEGFKIGTPLLGATEASTELVKVRAIENVFAIRGEDVDAKQKLSLPQIRLQIEQASSRDRKRSRGTGRCTLET